MTNLPEILEQDRQYLLHPLHHPASHGDPLVVVGGEGIRVHTADGRSYIDGSSGLWNILVGLGVKELAQAAHQQMIEMAYYSNYVGATNYPAVELAQELAGFAYPDLKMTYFTSGGGESNESAFKTARYYWKRMGKPDKIKIISREHAYHGVTMAAMSATGVPSYWPMFEPRVPGFLHIPAPYPFRYSGDIMPGETVGQAAARALEEAIILEGPGTVAAFIAEPVQGAGGVIVPPDDYFPRIREICDKYEVLLISDEVITGFGRTGKWFGLSHWGIQPDIMSFAKGITSGYLPLGGIQISDEIREVIMSAPKAEGWMHAYTYSGHATCCAVGLRNLALLKEWKLTEKASKVGAYLLGELKKVEEDFDIVGEARGIGLMTAVEMVPDPERTLPSNLGSTVQGLCKERGLYTRIMGNILILAPPLIITEAEVDEIIGIVREALEEVE